MAVAIVFISSQVIDTATVYKPLKPTSLMYIPIDERPVNLSYVTEILAATNTTLLIPPVELLSQKGQAANIEGLWEWILAECSACNYLVLASDAVIYGGLIPSRTHNSEFTVLEEYLNRLDKIKEHNPQLKIYTYSTVMRTPREGTDEEPAYYRRYGAEIFQLSALRDKKELSTLNPEENRQLEELEAQIPVDVLEDWSKRRQKNQAVNQLLLKKCREGIVDYLVLCRDDCAIYSQSNLEYRQLSSLAVELDLENYVSFPGTDEVGLILLTRAFNDIHGLRPKVAVCYAPGAGGDTIPGYEDQRVEESILQRIVATGSEFVDDIKACDLLLAVNTPEDGVTGEAALASNIVREDRAQEIFIQDLKRHLANKRQVALADIKFANGADNSLLYYLAEQKLIPNIVAYSGFNTAGNSIGYALGQGLLAPYMSWEDRSRILLARFLDDWGYQANIRQQVYAEKIVPMGLEKHNVGKQKTYIEEYIKERLLEFREQYLPKFPACEIEVRIPWNRIFEVEVICQTRT